ncbi:hypothetical protein ACS0TY_006103 [Phlomoides rotata]
MALFSSKKGRHKNQLRSIVILSTAILLIVVTLLHRNHPSIQDHSSVSSLNSAANIPSTAGDAGKTDDRALNHPAEMDNMKNGDDGKCDIFTGEWIPNPEAPYYTNMTCFEIHEHQNCMKYGRPDTDYLKWRWKPNGCDLQVFDPHQFLDLLRGKKLAFVGDSVGRNQMQSLICLLSRAEYPMDISPTADYQFKRYKYRKHNFTLSYYWSPFLVRYTERDSDGPSHTGVFNLYLDEFDDKWTSEIGKFDYVVLNAGHWFRRIAVYHENGGIVGCRYCGLPNVSFLPETYPYRLGFRTALRALNQLQKPDAVTILRTFAPPHFEGGDWNEGGNCVRQRPFRSDETRLDGMNLEMYKIQLEEFRGAEKEGKKKMRLMDTTLAMQLRPDGHPSRYGHWPNANVSLYNDCVHWCLPGPIDSLGDVLLHMLKMEVGNAT